MGEALQEPRSQLSCRKKKAYIQKDLFTKDFQDVTIPQAFPKPWLTICIFRTPLSGQLAVSPLLGFNY